MRTLGRRLSGLLRAGDLVVLSGPLGAGKTTLTQGIGAGLGVRGSVTSPTFVIARVHPSLSSGPDLVHADAYRLGSRAEVDDLDLDNDLATAVTVVEWGEGLVEDLASSFLSVGIRADQAAANGDEAGDVDVRRTVRVQGWGDRWHGTAVAGAIHLALTGLG
jgi:tRNA threonylcarbamoyladenosine biosynthesis protein TsaE